MRGVRANLEDQVGGLVRHDDDRPRRRSSRLRRIDRGRGGDHAADVSVPPHVAQQRSTPSIRAERAA